MTQPIRIPVRSLNSSASSERWKHFLLMGAVANISIWGIALLTLKLAPATYTSEWAIILPGAGSATNVNVDGIGGAYSQSQSPFSSNSRDPRANYQFIATSEPVLKAAAAQLNMPLTEFGKPKIKIIENTTLMTFTLPGSTPQEAQKKAFALHKAWEAKINALRIKASAGQDMGRQQAMSSSQQKLIASQNKLAAYKASSLLSDQEQIKNLSFNVEQFRKQRADTLGQQKEVTARIQYLSKNLNLSTQQGRDAFVLQADLILQQKLKEYNEASEALAALGTKFTPTHPSVALERNKRDVAKAAMLERSQVLLGRPISQETLAQLNLKDGPTVSSREDLLKQLVTSQTEQKALEAQLQVLDREIAQFEQRLKTLAQQGSKIDTLERDRQVAEAVFSSTLASLDIGKSDTFAAYPLTQMAIEPNLPEKPSWPNKTFLFLGAALGSLFCTSGIVLLWLRPHLLKQKNSKSAPGI